MSKPIEIRQYCPLFYNEKAVYFYVTDDNLLVFRGCEEVHTCKSCKQCCELASPKAHKYIADEISKSTPIQ